MEPEKVGPASGTPTEAKETGIIWVPSGFHDSPPPLPESQAQELIYGSCPEAFK